MRRKRRKRSITSLSPRARQALELLYRMGEAGVSEVLAGCDLIPTYSAARSVLRSLALKGLVRHEARGMRYVYRPTVPKERQERSILSQVLENFFDGSPEKTMRALLDISRDRELEIDYDELERMIRLARREGR